MLQSFFNLTLTTFRMIISLFQQTDLGGFSYETVLVSVIILTLIIRVIFVIMK